MKTKNETLAILNSISSLYKIAVFDRSFQYVVVFEDMRLFKVFASYFSKQELDYIANWNNGVFHTTKTTLFIDYYK